MEDIFNKDIELDDDWINRRGFGTMTINNIWSNMF